MEAEICSTPAPCLCVAGGTSRLSVSLDEVPASNDWRTRFRFYKGGVLSGTCGTELDHGIAAVGYGVASDVTKYWLMKNSWDTSWGEDGYIRMERDIADEEGLCGLAMQPSYPAA
ncbi:hypothetical protein BS78_K095100 [Paspalum vaginatum]|uniref:Peptidase C1A papain C-terminal domain-containing protein n=1 Tax=Paspalum vaginatum TaxID=158149 RepID=A0A9W7XBG2_9POAL|nr:hypothetical protein BS78_K095100 [Paspalum vaginatum]